MNRFASVIIVTYNSEKYIRACLDSIHDQKYPHEIIVVDNNSKDRTIEIVSKDPNVRFLETHSNLGYSVGNNIGTRYARGEYLVFLNPDTVVEDKWLIELIKPLEKTNRVITTPKILTYDGKKINTCGNTNHFTGLTFTRGYEETPNKYDSEEEVSGFSGCCFAIRKKDFERLGGFDEFFFLYNEDSDMSWRAQLNGFTIKYMPSSIVMHDYRLRMSAKKIYHLEKGRYLILRKYMPIKYIGAFLFSLLVTEALTFGYSIRFGRNGLKNKILAIKDGLSINVDRVTGDWTRLLKALKAEIPIDQLTYNQADKNIKIIANKIFYWNLRLLR